MNYSKTFLKKIVKQGKNSIIIIPKNIIKELKLKEKTEVQIILTKIQNKIILARKCSLCENINYLDSTEIEQGFYECKNCEVISYLDKE